MNIFDITFLEPEHKKEMKTVKLITGTNVACGESLLRKEFNDLSWWSDNLETVAHYYEGKVIEIEVELHTKEEMEYTRMSEYIDVYKYTYGHAEVTCPKGAIWYSFSGEYLKKNVVSIKEVYPDMKEFNEEGAGY